jgi:hypothetical protein
MSVSTISESRVHDRVLAFTRDEVIRRVEDNVFELSALMSMTLGRLSHASLGPIPMQGRGKVVQSGGASVEPRHNLGKNTTATDIPGPWSTIDVTASDTVRHSRANWKGYVASAVVSEEDLLVNRGDQQVVSLIEFETTNAMNSIADLIGDHAYQDGSVTTRITDLQTIVGTGALQGITPSTFNAFYSRGLSARGTAPGSVTFTSGSFASQGLDDMRTCWNNASEGSIMPHGVFSTYDIFQFYEGSLQPQERFTQTDVANGGFQQLAFKAAPFFPDPKCNSGELYMLHFGTKGYAMYVLEGADFMADDFHPVENQEARISKLRWKGTPVIGDRRFMNKMISVTA